MYPELMIPWHHLSDPEVVWWSLWQLILKLELGCGYVNTYIMACLDVFKCNTNIQIGEVSQVYYSTLHGSKSAQKEDDTKEYKELFMLSCNGC
jgi:hypothetical protein